MDFYRYLTSGPILPTVQRLSTGHDGKSPALVLQCIRTSLQVRCITEAAMCDELCNNTTHWAFHINFGPHVHAYRQTPNTVSYVRRFVSKSNGVIRSAVDGVYCCCPE